MLKIIKSKEGVNITCKITKCLSVDGGYYLEGGLSNPNEDTMGIWTATLDHDLNIIKFTPESLTVDEIESIKLEIKRYEQK